MDRGWGGWRKGPGREGGNAREKYQPKSHMKHGSSLQGHWGQRRPYLKIVLIRPWGTQKGYWWKAALWGTHILRHFASLDVRVDFDSQKKDADAIIFGEWKHTENLCAQKRQSLRQ